MVCGGFACSKNALVTLNILYILVAFILIGIAAVSRAVAMITSLALVGSIIACGVFLLIVALIGLVGAVKHHQVLLFFYMIILFLLFLLQFALACACLAVNRDQQHALVTQGWKIASKSDKTKVQQQFECCALDMNTRDLGDDQALGHPSCSELACCATSAKANNGTSDCSDCPTCWVALSGKIENAFKVTGGVGMLFSFTEILGVWVTVRFRNLKDPRANPSAFL